MSTNYFEGNSAKEILESFDETSEDSKRQLEGATIYFARYIQEDYTGHAVVIFTSEGKLYEVNGSHCSCYGLEGQWTPEETSWEAIAMRFDEELKELAAKHLGEKV